MMDFDKEEDLTLEQAVSMSIGAGSMCWGNMPGAGIFQSEEALEIVDDLVNWINENYDARRA